MFAVKTLVGMRVGPNLARLSTSLPMLKTPPKTMAQIEVDEPHVQEQLGRLQMNLVKKAEAQNVKRAQDHRLYRKKDYGIAITCFTLIISIYTYTIFAIKQEKFLDDFEMPEDDE